MGAYILRITKTYIQATEDDELLEDTTQLENDFVETFDDLEDTVDEVQDQLEDVEEDTVDIELDNNIDGHCIAECDNCHGVFISAVIESDQEIKTITGICPLCDKETEQELKWGIHKI